MPKHLVIVESPTKAKTLKRYLGDDFIVESSVGHVRDLPANAKEVPAALKKEKWARLGVNVEKDFEPLYVVSADKKSKITELRKLLKGADELLLATDEDREGEAISWHLVELLKPKIPVKRMVFHEITKQAILRSIEATREIDTNMVQAQETRRIIDRLFGFEVSEILWRKVARGLSAGRVQSVAVRLLVEREHARMRFRRASYWDLVASFKTSAGGEFDARLLTVDGGRVASHRDFDPDTGKLKTDDKVLMDEAQSATLAELLRAGSFLVSSAEETPFKKRPRAPFTTSTLQQEGSRKLRFNARRTMRAAQGLYERGFITYMRTDSVALSGDAVRMTREAIAAEYGAGEVPDSPRSYANKVKNAQEAHEAIRPAGDRIRKPSEVTAELGGDEGKVYELIWKRTMASQMKDAHGRRMTLVVEGSSADRKAEFRASGSVIDSPGFLRAYVEGRDDGSKKDDSETILPPVAEGDSLGLSNLECESHETSPPSRLTDASLVKQLEELGIGRPSTYASIIDTIERRGYAERRGSALIPTFSAFAVVKLLSEHFTHFVDYDFTAKMEDRLDAIARGEDESLPYLKEFYFGTDGKGLQDLLERKIEEIDAREMCSIPIGVTESGDAVVARVGRYGPYVQSGESTAQIPDGTAPDELTIERAAELIAAVKRADTPIGHDPETKKPVYVKSGRYGPYVQLGDRSEDSDEKPKMVSLLDGMTPETITFETALKLLELPRPLGNDAEGKLIEAGVGRYGPYVKRERDYRSLQKGEDVLTVTLERALELLAQEKRSRRTPEPIKTFENIEQLGGASIRLMEGRYGPYITDGEYNQSLRKGMDAAELTLEQALDLLEIAKAKGPPKKRRGRKKTTRKKASKKTAKKKTAKKKASKKKASKKNA